MQQGITAGHTMSWGNARGHAAGVWKETRHLTVTIYNELFRTRVFTVAAALAFFFLWSLAPLLILLSSMLKFLPIPNLHQQMLNMMGQLVPGYAMGFVRQVMSGILSPNRTKLLSFGLVVYLWGATGGFSSLIEALDIAYDVRVSRAWWKDRARALVLTLIAGVLASVSLLAFVIGPHFGHLLRDVFAFPAGLEQVWPTVRVMINFITFVVGLELIYYLGPNAHHTLVSTLPGSVLAIAVWFLGSWGLSYYLSHLSNYSATYGSMGALIALMLWFYFTALAILMGAELNAERAKYRRHGAGTRAQVSEITERR
jgi:membrane protein